MRNLNYRAASSGIRCILDEPISFLQIDIIMQQSPRSHRIDFQHCCVYGLDSRRHNNQIFGFDSNRVPPRADVVRQDYQVTRADIRHVCANFGNHSSAFESGRRRQLCSHRIFSFDLVQVGGVDRCRARFHNGFTFGWRRPWPRFNM